MVKPVEDVKEHQSEVIQTEIPPLIAEMLRPGFYPHGPKSVELIQTHISYVLLAGHLVYKIKKPVDYGFLNFTTLPRRLYFCRKELELNMRLAPDLYLSVVSIREKSGKFSLSGKGRVVEYAVVMKRLPEGSLLVHRLEDGTVNDRMMKDLAGVLARFHGRSPAGPRIQRWGRISILRRNIEEDFAQTLKYRGRTVSKNEYDLTAGYSRSFIRRHRALLLRRAVEGRIRDGHGDLHAEHVGWIAGAPFVFDCIEFSTRFRCADVAAELAFLIMDLEYRGAHKLARAFLLEYLKITQDAEILPLLDFYLCYRAYVRGKVHSFLSDDTHLASKAVRIAARTASRYLRLAAAYARRDSRPILAVVTGLAGTGKSTIADMLSDRLSFKVVRSDLIRKRLAGMRPGKKVFDDYSAGLYSPAMTARTYETVIAEGRRLLGAGSDVVLDATFIRQDHRMMARGLARDLKARFRLMETGCGEAAAKKRLLDRAAQGTSISDGRWEIYRQQRKRYEKPIGFHRDEYSFINTGVDREALYRSVLGALYPMRPVTGPHVVR